MTPTPGTDCFVVLSCNEGGEACSVVGSAPVVGSRDQYPIQVFIDDSGYVWVAIIQYATTVGGDTIPYWVQLYKSIEALDCAEVSAAELDGYQPEGPGATEWFELQCEGLHANWEDSDCPSTTTAPLFYAPVIAIRFFRSRFGCCLAFTDPCNPIPDGACDGAGGDDCVHCLNCDGGIAPRLMLFEADRNYGPLAYADGSFVIRLWPDPCESPAHECEWRGCFAVNDPSGNAIRSIQIVVTLGGTSGEELNFTVYHYTSSDCSGTCYFIEQDATVTPAGNDCVNMDYEWDAPSGYSFSLCSGGPSPIPTWSPYFRVRAL